MKNVIIIGSGIGGLIAGNLLAKKGHKVTIFECLAAIPPDFTGRVIILRAALFPLKPQHRYSRP